MPSTAKDSPGPVETSTGPGFSPSGDLLHPVTYSRHRPIGTETFRPVPTEFTIARSVTVSARTYPHGVNPVVFNDHVDPTGASELVDGTDVVSENGGSGNGESENDHEPKNSSRASNDPVIVMPAVN